MKHAPGQGSAARSHRVLVLSTLAFSLLFAVWLMLGVLAVPIQAELGLSALEFTWVTAIAVLSGSVLRLPFGILTDRYGGRRVLGLLTLACAVPCFLLGSARSFVEVMIYAFLFGFAGNAFSVGIAWNAAYFDRARQGFALGTFGAGNVGAAVTKLIGPALIAWVPASGLLGGAIGGGWRFVPALYALLLIVTGIAIFWLAPRPDVMPGAGRPLREMLGPLRDVRVFRFGLYYVVVFGAYVALSLWLPRYYTSVYGLSLTHAALLTALFIFPASLLRPLGGWLSDRFGPRPVTYAVFGAMLLACIPLVAPTHFSVGPKLFFALIEVLGIGMGIGKASVYKYIPDYYPADVGLVGGVVGTLGALGGFFLPLGFGYLEMLMGRPEACFWILLALILTSFGWLHRVVTGMRLGHARLRPRADALDGGDSAARRPHPAARV